MSRTVTGDANTGVTRKPLEEDMFNQIRRSLVLVAGMALAGLVVAPQPAAASQAPGRASRAEHAIAGGMRKVDHTAQTVAIRTADGAEKTVTFTGRQIVHGARGVARATRFVAVKTAAGARA